MTTRYAMRNITYPKFRDPIRFLFSACTPALGDAALQSLAFSDAIDGLPDAEELPVVQVLRGHLLRLSYRW